MSIDIRLPNITSPTSEGQIAQIRSYLYQLAEQLKWAFNSIEVGSGASNADEGTESEEDTQAEVTSLDEIKSLIINSADIVNAYTDKIVRKIDDKYVAGSVFSEHVEQAEQQAEDTSASIEKIESDIQEIRSSIEDGISINRVEKIGQYDGLDFNELLYETGYYESTSAPGATGCSNYPVDKEGVLEVVSRMTQNDEDLTWTGLAYQTYRTYAGEVYARAYHSSSGFSVWEQRDGLVEQGNFDIWTYRKWASGWAECVGKITIILNGEFASLGDLLYTKTLERVNYPFAFSAVPTEQVTASSDYALWLFTEHHGENTATQTRQYVACFAEACTEPCSVTLDFRVTGRYK